MKKNIILIYGVTALVVFVILSSLFSLRIYSNTQSNTKRGDDVFEQMSKIVRNGYLAGDRFFPAFNKNVKAMFNYDKRLQSIVVKNNDNNILYYYFTNPNLVDIDVSKNLSEYKHGKLFTLYKGPVKVIANPQNLKIEILYKVTDRKQIMYIFKGLMTYVFVFIVFTSLAVVVCFGKPVTSRKDSATAPEIPKEKEVIDINFDHKPQDYGFADMKYFEIALNDTLIEAKSLNRDVVLAEFKFTEKVDAETWKLAGEVCEECFSRNDPRFEVSNAKFAVIFPDTGLDEGLQICLDFIKAFSFMNGKNILFAGISSRNGRDIDAQCLVEETKAALFRCTEEENIVALKTDPDKYRNFICNKY